MAHHKGRLVTASRVLQDFAEAQDFQLAERQYHADDQAVAQYYLAIADRYTLPAAAAPTEDRFQAVLDNPSSVSLDHSVRGAHPLGSTRRGCPGASVSASVSRRYISNACACMHNSLLMNPQPHTAHSIAHSIQQGILS